MKTLKILGPSHKKPDLYYGQLENGRIIDVARVGNEWATMQRVNDTISRLPVCFDSIIVIQ